MVDNWLVEGKDNGIVVTVKMLRVKKFKYVEPIKLDTDKIMSFILVKACSLLL